MNVHIADPHVRDRVEKYRQWIKLSTELSTELDGNFVSSGITILKKLIAEREEAARHAYFESVVLSSQALKFLQGTYRPPVATHYMAILIAVCDDYPFFDLRSQSLTPLGKEFLVWESKYTDKDASADEAQRFVSETRRRIVDSFLWTFATTQTHGSYAYFNSNGQFRGPGGALVSAYDHKVPQIFIESILKGLDSTTSAAIIEAEVAELVNSYWCPRLDQIGISREWLRSTTMELLGHCIKQRSLAPADEVRHTLPTQSNRQHPVKVSMLATEPNLQNISKATSDYPVKEYLPPLTLKDLLAYGIELHYLVPGRVQLYYKLPAGEQASTSILQDRVEEKIREIMKELDDLAEGISPNCSGS